MGTWVLGLPSLPLLNIHGKQRLLPANVIRPATPRPIPRMIHQAALYRIGVHVIQLLPLLSPAIDIEIVKPCLPERPQRFTRCRKRQSAGGPEKGFLILYLERSIRNSRLHNLRVAQKRGGCPRFGVGTWVLELPSLRSQTSLRSSGFSPPM